MATGVFGVRLLGQPGFRLVALGLVAAIVVIYRAIQLAYLTTLPQWGYDLSFYWTAASHLLNGAPIYSATQLAGPYAPQGQDGFLYPPPFAAFAIPLVWLAPGGARAAEWLWSGLGLIVLVASVLAVARHERIGERYPVLAGNGRWLLVVAAFAFAPVIGELSIGNVHLLLLGLFSAAWLGIRRADRAGDWLAGFVLGAAALIKVFPGVLLLWLILTRRFRAALAMIVAIAALTLVSLPITGLEPWRQFPTVLANLSAVTETTDTISLTTWLSPVLGFTVARWLVAAVGLAIVAWAALRQGRGLQTRLSFAIAVVVAVLIAPNVYHHYLAIFVLPLLLGLAGGVPLRWLVLAYLLMSGGDQPAFGDLAWVVNRVMPTLGALVLLAALALSSRPSTQAETGRTAAAGA